MNNPTKLTEFKQKYNTSEALLEIISNEYRLQTVIEDIKADRHIHIEITRFIYDTDYYKGLESRLQSLRDELAGIQDIGERFEKGKGITELEEEEKRYKIDILTTASTLYKVRDTEKIEITKHHFFKGEIKQAYQSIQAKDLSNAQETLLGILKTQEKLEEVYEKLIDNANEYLIKAELTSLNLDIENPENRFQMAVEFFEKGKVSAERAKKEEFVAKYYFDYAHFLQKHNQNKEATLLYQKTLSILKNLAQQNSEAYLPDIVAVLNNLGTILKDQGLFTEAREAYEYTLGILRNLSQKNSEVYLFNLAATLNNLGELYRTTNQFQEAIILYQEALEIYQRLFKHSSTKYEPNIALTLNNLAILFKAYGQFQKATQYYKEALNIYRNLSEYNPTVYEHYVATILNNFGSLCDETNQFREAEFLFKESLEIRKKLVLQNPYIYIPHVANSLNNIAILLSKQDKFQKAKEYYCEALEYYQKLAVQDADTYERYVATILNNLGNIFLANHQFPQAKEYYDAALLVYRKLAKENIETYEPTLATILNNLANVLSEDEEYFQVAITHYYEALEIQRKLSKRYPNVYEKQLAQTLNNLALLLSNQGQFQKAKGIYEECLDIRMYIYQKKQGHIDLMEVSINFAIFYLQTEGYQDREKSIALCKKCILVGLDLNKNTPKVMAMCQTAIQILNIWGFDVEPWLNSIKN